jgi:hypothetical protein
MTPLVREAKPTMSQNLLPNRLTQLFAKLMGSSPLRWEFPNCVTRMDVIQLAIDTLGAKRYLEIGVSDGACFCSINVSEKIGVDPVNPSAAVKIELNKPGVQYFAVESDKFFERDAPSILADGVDVVFIDGLHTYEQAYRDFTNSLKHLRSHGLILLHDCLPTSELEAIPAKSYQEAIALNNGCSSNGDWVGDVWKVVLRLRAQHTELKTCVLHSDHGIGMIYKGQNNARLDRSLRQIEAMTYSDLTSDVSGLLNLRKPKELLVALNQLKTG